MTENKGIMHTESEKEISYGRPNVHLTIKCRIEEFAALMDTTKMGEGRLRSEGASSKLASRAVWKLLVYPNGKVEPHKGSISVFLWLTGPVKDCKKNLDATYNIYLVDGSGKTDSLGRGTENFGKRSNYNWGGNVTHDRVKKALHADGSLLVTADVEFLPPDDSGALHDYKDQQRWAANFFQLYDNQTSSDCSIQVGGVSIPAHKYPLMAQSPIFHRMFTNPLAEEFKSSIADFKEPEPMRALIRYCYMGFLDAATMDGEWAVEMFKLADRYCIEELKAQLERHFIEKRLSAKNVVALAVLADAHSAAKLKEATIELIASGGSAVFEIDEWKERSDGELIAEVFQLAEKYSITGLKTQLQEHFIRKRLSVENAVRMAVLADAYSAPKLMEACTKLIASEGKTIFKSATWKELKKARPEFTTDLAEAAITEK